MNGNQLTGMALGRLATNDEVAEIRSEGTDVFIESENVYNGRMFIKPLSRLPFAQRELKMYTCNFGECPDLADKPEYMVKDGMNHKYVAFTPVHYPDNTHAYKGYCANPHLLDVENLADGEVADKLYFPVPCINLDDNKLEDFDTLEKYLEAGYKPSHMIKFSAAFEDMPYLFYAFRVDKRSSEGYVYKITHVNVASTGPVITVASPEDNKVRVDILEMVRDGIYDSEESIFFMPADVHLKLYNRITVKNGGKKTNYLDYNLLPGLNSGPLVNDALFKELAKVDISTLAPDPKEEEPEKEPEPSKEPEAVPVPQEKSKPSVSVAEKLLKEFKDLAQGNLLYDDKDIINFDICVHTSKFVILSGLSGTGKSQLVRTYAKALRRVNKETVGTENMLMIPVSPSWTDDADILGFIDYKKEMYQPADTGLVSFLMAAARHPDAKYLVCFDEMNLAKVEHYFSQFISILELPQEERKLRLYSEDMTNFIKNNTMYPSTIPILDNVCFVGTVNIDESTTPISDKMLDRANKIELEIKSFVDMEDMLEGKLTQAELWLLKELHEAFNEAEPKLGIGYRIVRQMGDYLHMAKTMGDSFTREQGLDYLITQRVITKLRGSNEQVGELVTSIVPGILAKYSELSSFDKAHKLLRKKEKELKIYGYTI